MPSLGWQPSRFLADRAEAERAFALAERLGSVNAAAQELDEWVRCEEQYATLAANVVVELYGESHARRPTTRAWAIIRPAHRIHRLVGQRANRAERRHRSR